MYTNKHKHMPTYVSMYAYSDSGNWENVLLTCNKQMPYKAVNVDNKYVNLHEVDFVNAIFVRVLRVFIHLDQFRDYLCHIASNRVINIYPVYVLY